MALFEPLFFGLSLGTAFAGIDGDSELTRRLEESLLTGGHVERGRFHVARRSRGDNFTSEGREEVTVFPGRERAWIRLFIQPYKRTAELVAEFFWLYLHIGVPIEEFFVRSSPLPLDQPVHEFVFLGGRFYVQDGFPVVCKPPRKGNIVERLFDVKDSQQAEGSHCP
ncbi:MAG: hypothetical protein ACOC8H_02415 [bacterium]